VVEAIEDRKTQMAQRQNGLEVRSPVQRGQEPFIKIFPSLVMIVGRSSGHLGVRILRNG